MAIVPKVEWRRIHVLTCAALCAVCTALVQSNTDSDSMHWPGWPFVTNKLTFFSVGKAPVDDSWLTNALIACALVLSTGYTIECALRRMRSWNFRLGSLLRVVTVVGLLLALYRFDSTFAASAFEWRHGPFHSGAWVPREEAGLLYNPLSGASQAESSSFPSTPWQASTGPWPASPWYVRWPIFFAVGCAINVGLAAISGTVQRLLNARRPLSQADS